MEVFLSLLNKVIEIEDEDGNTLFAFETNEKGDIIGLINCDIADIDEDYLLGTDKDLIRLQKN